MYFEICIGTEPFSERPDVRLQQLVYGMLLEFDSNLVRQWDTYANATTCRVFGDWYWEVPCFKNRKKNQQIVESFMRQAQVLYNQGLVRIASIDIQTD